MEEPHPEALKHTSAAYKLELGKLEVIKKASLTDSRRRYDTGLAKLQNEMTAAQQVEAALHVKKLREEVATAEPPPAGASSTAAVAMPSPQSGSENLLINGSFQKGTQKWEMTTHEPSANPSMFVDKKVLFHDKATLRVINLALTDTHISQTVKVKPNTRYRMSGFIKVEGITDAKGRSATGPGAKMDGGACIYIEGRGRKKSRQVNDETWTEVAEEYTTTDETELVFECRLGYFGGTVSGKAWFAELALTEVNTAP